MFPFSYEPPLHLYVLAFVAYCIISVAVGFTANWIFRTQNQPNNNEELPGADMGQQNRGRGRRNRRAQSNNPIVAQDDNTNEMRDPVEVEPMAKVGAKKRAKLEAKAERKIQREAEIKLREERKLQQEEEEKERKLKEEQEKLEEERKEEERVKAEEEQRRKEEDEYQKLKIDFSVEAEGYEADDIDGDDGNLFKKFVDHLKENKVVMIEDVACKFRMKSQSVLDRIQQLQSDGLITGVIDDRGKFIYITEDELKAVADFINKRGRVTLQELVENSNKLIRLNETPVASA